MLTIFILTLLLLSLLLSSQSLSNNSMFSNLFNKGKSSSSAAVSTIVSSSSSSSSSSISTICDTNSLTINDRKQAALFGLFVADSVAMPVHWYYDRRQLIEDYGTIKGYVKPKDRFVGSILNLSNTGGYYYYYYYLYYLHYHYNLQRRRKRFR